MSRRLRAVSPSDEEGNTCYNMLAFVLQEENLGNRFKTKELAKSVSADEEGDTPIS